MQAPLGCMLARLGELLEEWPDHPLLSQLAAICRRVLQLPLNSPLKAVLTGLELLLAQAQARQPMHEARLPQSPTNQQPFELST